VDVKCYSDRYFQFAENLTTNFGVIHRATRIDRR